MMSKVSIKCFKTHLIGHIQIEFTIKSGSRAYFLNSVSPVIVARIATSGLHFEKHPKNKKNRKSSSSNHSAGGYLLASGK